MALTPDDIRNKEFRTGLRGADFNQVHEFLHQIAAEVEIILTEREMLKKQLADSGKLVTEFQQIEKMLRDSLNKAQANADAIKQNALKDAKRILEDAKKEASEIVERANLEKDALKTSIRSLKGQKIAFLQEMEGIIENYSRITERLKKETSQDEGKY